MFYVHFLYGMDDQKLKKDIYFCKLNKFGLIEALSPFCIQTEKLIRAGVFLNCCGCVLMLELSTKTMCYGFWRLFSC